MKTGNSIMNYPQPGLKKCDCGRVPMHYSQIDGHYTVKCKCGKDSGMWDSSADAINAWNGPRKQVSIMNTIRRWVPFMGCLLLLVSCNEQTVTIPKSEYQRLTGDTIPVRSFTVNTRRYEVNTGSDGHDYYYMQIGTGGYSSADRDFHYPSCKLCLKLYHYGLQNDSSISR